MPPRSFTSSSFVTITGGRAGRRDLLGRAREAIERLERRHPLLPVRQARQDRRQHAVAHDLPVGAHGDDQVPAALDPVDQGSAAQSIQCRHRLAVVGIEHDRPRRVIAVPSAWDRAVLDVDPRGDDLLDTDVVGTSGRDLESGQLHHRFNTLRAAEGENQVLVRHERFGTLRHRGVLRGTAGPPAVRVEQPDRDLRLARAGANIRREPLALVCSHLDRHAVRHGRSVIVGDRAPP